MSSRLTMIFAVVLFFGAIAAGYWGLVISKSADERVVELEQKASKAESDLLTGIAKNEALNELLSSKAEEVQRVPVVVLVRDVKAMSKIQAEDLAEEMLRVAPPGSFSNAQALEGSVVWRDLPAGSVLNQASFAVGGPLGRMIRPDERALAINIDEVTSAGGHLQPGDYVDALLFLRDDNLNSDRTAQVVIPALRVLSVGNTLGASTLGEPLTLPEAEDESNKSSRTKRVDIPRTVVLAIPESLLTRFMLATQAGVLRLAVRSVDEKILAAYQSGEAPSAKVEELKRQLFQFEKIAIKQAGRAQPGLAASPSRQATGIPVYSGRSLSRQNP